MNQQETTKCHEPKKVPVNNETHNPCQHSKEVFFLQPKSAATLEPASWEENGGNMGN